MSQTHSIVCHETKEKLWIGQGNGGMSCFYTGESETMEALRWFLDKNREYALNMVCNNNDNDEACVDYACWSGVYCDWRIKEHSTRLGADQGVDLGVFPGTLPQAIQDATKAPHLFFPPYIEYEQVKEKKEPWVAGRKTRRGIGKGTKTKSFYDFDTLHEACGFFNRSRIQMCDVKIGGSFGRDSPTEDDDPVFMWEA